MGTRTAIEWADGTWNPWSGCRKVSPGCKNCYMYRDMNRNVILGVSVENQDYLWRAETLADIPAAKRFISYEPALGFLELSPTVLKSIHWVISGGESMGRKSNEDWFRFMRDQCTTAGIAYFHKQHGGSKKIDGSWGGRLLDGEEWNQKP